jgi:hypothetical protein
MVSINPRPVGGTETVKGLKNGLRGTLEVLGDSRMA